MKSQFQNFTAWVRRWLPPARRVEQRLDNSLTPLPKGWGAIQWVLSRGIVRFARFDMKDVPASQRKQAIQLQIRQWSPFSDTATCIVLSHEYALVWAWERNRTEQLDGIDHARQRVAMIPETLLHPPLVDGVRLARCLDGVEAQWWSEGYLAASRWWPRSPVETEWIGFLRDIGLPATLPPPDLETVLLQEQPWLAPGEFGHTDVWRFEAPVVLAATFGLSTMTILSVAQWVQATDVLRTANERVLEMEQQAKPIQEARQRAFDRQEVVRQLQSLDIFPPQPVLLAEVGKRLPDKESYIKEWDFNSGRLKFSISSPTKPSASSLVKVYQDSGWFKDVKAPNAGDGTTLALEMQVVPLGEIQSAVLEGRNPESEMSVTKVGATQ